MRLDFKLSVYEEFCHTLISSGCEIFRVVDYINLFPPLENTKYIILRHDVDRNPNKALQMARIEKEYGIRSTYYFRTRAKVFNKDYIHRISEMGHEIGYHYENLSDAKGDFDLALKLFKKGLKKFKNIGIEIKSISMHGSPLSSFDNRDLWTNYSYYDLGISGEAYIDVDFSNTFYFSDTGRDYSGKTGNVRDRPLQDYLKNSEVKTTFDLITFIKKNQQTNLYKLASRQMVSIKNRYYLPRFCSESKEHL